MPTVFLVSHPLALRSADLRCHGSIAELFSLRQEARTSDQQDNIYCWHGGGADERVVFNKEYYIPMTDYLATLIICPFFMMPFVLCATYGIWLITGSRYVNLVDSSLM